MKFAETRDLPEPGRVTQWVRVDGVMAYLGVKSANTITKYVAQGMPHHRRGGKGVLLFDLAEVEEWVRSRWNATGPGQSTDRRIG